MWIIFVNSYKNCKLRKKLKIVGFLVEFFCRPRRAPQRDFFVSIQSHWPDFLSTSRRGAIAPLSSALCVPKILNGEFFPQGWINAPAVPEKGKICKARFAEKCGKNSGAFPRSFTGRAGRDAFTGKEKTPPSPQLFLSPEFWEYEACERERGGAGLAGGAGRVARSNIWGFWDGTPCDLRGFYPLWYNLPMKSCHLPFRYIQVN